MVEEKLLPLLVDCRDDMELVVTLTKIFVMLTMPMEPAVKSWCHVKIDPKAEPDMRRDMEKKKTNAHAQVRRSCHLPRWIEEEKLCFMAWIDDHGECGWLYYHPHCSIRWPIFWR